jgi:hypothetical protein
MPQINRASDSSNMIWQLIDGETGAVTGDISQSFTLGDRRIVVATRRHRP